MRCGLKVEDIPVSRLAELLIRNTPLIDVRAPVEFAAGHLPGAVNLPLLNDEERARVGTLYKAEGSAAAESLGHELVSGSVRAARIEAWLEFLRRHPDAVVYCFRGGLRSQISRQWMAEAGVTRPLLIGGYKAGRNFLLETISNRVGEREVLVVSGPTGAGKTALLHAVAEARPATAKYSVMDLELLAHHRGSAFGGWSSPQPSQINFENTLALALLKSPAGVLLLEDESRMIGKCVMPEVLFHKMRESGVVWIDEPIEERVANVLRDYVVAAPAQGRFENLRAAVHSISKRLGGVRTQEILSDLQVSQEEFAQHGSYASNGVWIRKLLEYYYDPLYFKDLERRNVRVVFKGRWQVCLEFLTGSGTDAVS